MSTNTPPTAKKGDVLVPNGGEEELADPCCMGRSRGGLTTKIDALVDANGMPVAIALT